MLRCKPPVVVGCSLSNQYDKPLLAIRLADRQHSVPRKIDEQIEE